jgi:predicted aldo/keto reductase-like oxidoreductase
MVLIYWRIILLEQRQLGRWPVSRLCFGSLGLGPLQNDLPLEEGSALLREALEMGINFIDTAELYGTYPYIKKALKGFSHEVVIASKSYASTYQEMAASVEQARRELDRDCIEIFLLHEQESAHTLRGHAGALEYLKEAKSKGIVGAIGISTHTIAGVRGGANHRDVEIISPLINCTGVGILDGSVEEMIAAMDYAHLMGKGLYGMKPLGGGHLSRRPEEAFSYLMGLPSLASIAVGMKNSAELEMNYRLFANIPIEDSLRKRVKSTERRLHIDSWCTGCGSCTTACPSQALTVISQQCQVDRAKCVFCGYCGAACPEFAIKII